MAIESYNNNTMLNAKYFNYGHVEERGGDPHLTSTYKLVVDMYFAGLTGRGYSAKSATTKEDFEKMVQYYYYIME
jgi:hypothetical protein